MADAGETTTMADGTEKESHMYDGPDGVNNRDTWAGDSRGSPYGTPDVYFETAGTRYYVERFTSPLKGFDNQYSVGRADLAVSHSSIRIRDNLTGEEVTVGFHPADSGTHFTDTPGGLFDDSERKGYERQDFSYLSAKEYNQALQALDAMLGGPVGSLNYNFVSNNCHDFAIGFYGALVNGDIQKFQNLLNNYGTYYESAPVPGYYGPNSPPWMNGLPPVVLDLDGDGLDLVAIEEAKAFYDIDGDGFLENVGWVGDGDGFLSIDLNGDGLILEPVELAFALSTDDPDDTDLEGLAATYDSNQDGVLDANDAEFAKFKVWRDIDQDGACDEGEVKTLAEHGITSINLKSDNKEEVIAGNKVYGTTSYTKSDGATGKVGDMGLATSAAGWKKEEVTGGVKFNYEGTGDNAGKALFEAAAATALIMDVGASGLIGAMGAELDDDLSTSGKEDVILGGGAGNDTITGGAGNDWLAGGEGIDSISGGDGHDILFVDSEDKIQGGDGFDVAIVTDDKAVTYDLAKIGIEAVSAGAGKCYMQYWKAAA